MQAQQTENRELEGALRTLRKETAEVDALHGIVRDYLARKHVTQVMAEGSSPSAEVFAALSRLPADIVLTRAETKDMHLVLVGVARGDDAVRKMTEQLAGTRFILHPRIARIDPAPPSDRFGAGARAFQFEADLRH